MLAPSLLSFSVDLTVTDRYFPAACLAPKLEPSWPVDGWHDQRFALRSHSAARRAWKGTSASSQSPVPLSRQSESRVAGIPDFDTLSANAVARDSESLFRCSPLRTGALCDPALVRG